METKKSRLPIDKLEQVANVLKAIAHPVKLEILEVLEQSEPLTVSEIREQVSNEVEQSMLSHHLIKMKDKGVLKSEKKGKQVYYSITDRQILKIFDCIENCEMF